MKQTGSLFGIVVMISAMAFFSLKDGLAKFIVTDVTPLHLIWLQFAVTFFLMAAVTYPKHGFQAFVPTPPGLQLWRGMTVVAGIGAFYWTLIYVPLAEASAMILIAPLVVTALSPFFLGEKIGPRRIAAVVIGFLGVLFILQPGFRGDIQGYLIGILTGLLYGLNYILTRKIGSGHSPLVGVAHSVLIGLVVLTPWIMLNWQPVPPAQYGTIIAFMLFAIIGHSCMISAFRYAPATVIAPYQYTVIVFAAAVGFLFFGTFPDVYSWAGIALIITAGLYIAVREARGLEATS